MYCVHMSCDSYMYGGMCLCILLPTYVLCVYVLWLTRIWCVCVSCDTHMYGVYVSCDPHVYGMCVCVPCGNQNTIFRSWFHMWQSKDNFQELIPSFYCESWESNAGHWVCMASSLTSWANSLPHGTIFTQLAQASYPFLLRKQKHQRPLGSQCYLPRAARPGKWNVSFIWNPSRPACIQPVQGPAVHSCKLWWRECVLPPGQGWSNLASQTTFLHVPNVGMKPYHAPMPQKKLKGGKQTQISARQMCG